MSEPSAHQEDIALRFYRLRVPGRDALVAIAKLGELERAQDLWIGQDFIARWNTVLCLCKNRLTVVVIRDQCPTRRFLELSEKGREMMAAVAAVLEHYVHIDNLRKARGRPDRRRAALSEAASLLREEALTP